MIAAFDPGATTGICSIEDNEFHHCQVSSLNELWRWLAVWQPTLIIYERFDKTAKYAELDPVEVIGVLKLYAEQRGIPTIPQSRSIKKFWSNDKLKPVGAYCAGYVNRHTTDAARHLLEYLVYKKKDQTWLVKLRPYLH